ncbi:MAG: GNAT family N-acetyltransferase, partial [Bacteroidia bacterium]|nr:GNAT family N-acetyltransferase [Bacteroidia bacterium]
MQFRVIEVNSQSMVKRFLKVPHSIYAGDPYWVCPLNMDIEAIFSPEKNALFKDGEAKRWVLVDEKKSQDVGRIAAFYSWTKAKKYEVPVGGAGFFECINNQEAANLLFDTAKQWLSSKGMQAMDAPINFGENDRFWGCLTEGFMQPGYGMPYNLPYYSELFINYGFKLYFEQHSRHLDISKPMPERFYKIYEWVKSRPGVHFETVDRRKLDKYARDFVEIYNDGWKFHEHFTPLTMEVMQKLIKQLEMVLIDEMICFAYVDYEPAGFLLCLPDLNQIFKPMKGEMGIWETIKFLWRRRNQFEWYRKNGILYRGRVTIMGVKPKFQKYGLESGMILFPMEKVKALGFKEIELSWVG